MPQIWPFKPRSELIESLEWLTDVIRTETSEQRFALREAPRRYFNLTHLLNRQEYSAARAMIRGATSESDFMVPDWAVAVSVGDVESGTSVEFAGTGLSFSVSDAALIWESSSSFEQISIDEVGTDGCIVAGVVGEYSSAKLMPLHTATIPRGLDGQRSPAKFTPISVFVQLTDSEDLGASDLTQYRGHDILTVCPVVANGRFSEPINWPVEPIDNNLAVPSYLRQRDVPDARFMMRWHYFTRSEISDLRYWIHSRRGRWKSFWLSSWAADLEPSASIGSSDLILRVFKLPGIEDLGQTDFDLEIRTTSGVSYYVQVTDVNDGPTISGRDSLILTIDSAIGTAITLAAISRISFMRHVRFDADRIEFDHRAGAGAAVAVPCIEVPV